MQRTRKPLKLTDKTILVKCDHCDIEFIKYRKDLGDNNYCTMQCFIDASQKENIRTHCKQCGTEIIRTISSLTKITNTFCSQTCGAIYNNAHTPRKRMQPLGQCIECGESIPRSNKYCPKCRKKYYSSRIPTTPACFGENTKHIPLPNNDFGDITLEAVIHKSKYSTNVFSRIREHAKRIILFIFNVKVQDMKCSNCGYGKHVEICHIKSVSSFPKDAKISEVNALENLTILCPNCHWELDHSPGIIPLTIRDIQDRFSL